MEAAVNIIKQMMKITGSLNSESCANRNAGKNAGFLHIPSIKRKSYKYPSSIPNTRK
jgi:hypothetical protein